MIATYLQNYKKSPCKINIYVGPATFSLARSAPLTLFDSRIATGLVPPPLQKTTNLRNEGGLVVLIITSNMAESEKIGFSCLKTTKLDVTW